MFTTSIYQGSQPKKPKQPIVDKISPQPDIASRIPNTFTLLLPASPIDSASPYAPAAHQPDDCKNEKVRPRSLSKAKPTGSTSGPSANGAQATNNVYPKDGNYIRHMHIEGQFRTGARSSEISGTEANRFSLVNPSQSWSPSRYENEGFGNVHPAEKPLVYLIEGFSGTENELREDNLPARTFKPTGVGPQPKYKAALMSKPAFSHHGRLSLRRRRANRFSIRRNVLPTPSDILLAALPRKAEKALAPLETREMSLSYVGVRQWEKVSRRGRIGNRPRLWRDLHAKEQLLSRHKQIGKRTSLSLILSRYLNERSNSEERALSQLHEAETLDYLKSKGYTPDDVLTWSRILLSSDAKQAVSKFVAAAGSKSSSDLPSLPTFLLTFILRARSLKGVSLRLLLDYIWKHYVGSASESDPQHRVRILERQAAMIMIVRLIRHARIVLPSSLEEIAQLATKMIGLESGEIATLNRQHIQEIAHLYNRLLTLFAMPTSQRPFMSIAIQQQAQFAIIRKMVTFKPHLPISREGFRALTRVQLAHKKTEEERKWARSKALSWPPWKEELLGIEAGSEDPGKNSRAIGVLTRSIEAGYSHSNWERTARILAGWDTDDSPTIQTRSFFEQVPILRNEDVQASGEQSIFEQNQMWAARITATRTVREAWACFTSFEKSCEDHSVKPYSAMFSKLLYAGIRDVEYDNEKTSVVPGDSKETWPEPTSPHDFLYVPSEPPSINSFFDLMTKRGIKPAKYLLAELLDRAEDLEEGFKYIHAGRLRQQEKDILLGSSERSAEEIRIACTTIAPRVVAAFVRLLCRVQWTPNITFTLPSFSKSQREVLHGHRTKSPFLYAQSFIFALQSSYRPIWYALFHGFNRRILVPHPSTLQKWWSSVLSTLREMDELGIDLEFDGFTDLAEIFEEIHLTHRVTLPQQEQGWLNEADPKSQSVLLCKSIFNAIAYGGSIQSKFDVARTKSWLPLNRSSASSSSSTPYHTDLIDIPLPIILHRTVRILGTAEDNLSIVTLLHWMHLYSPQLTSVAAERANGKKHIRYTIAAVRYFLEKTWRDDDFNQRAALFGEWEEGQRELVMEAKTIVEGMVEEWGGWPGDEELARYHAVNRRKAGRLRAGRG